jgi:hypothetical protein
MFEIQSEFVSSWKFVSSVGEVNGAIAQASVDMADE